MLWVFITLPAMLLAIAAAVVPVLHTMLRDERVRKEARTTAAFVKAAAPVGRPEVDEEDFESALAA